MTGALVKYCGHEGWFFADSYEVAGAIVIRASGAVRPENLIRDLPKYDAKDKRYHLVDFPKAGFWRPDLGVFVVPANQFNKL